jgi:adenosylhomocysteine nucleosidase
MEAPTVVAIAAEGREFAGLLRHAVRTRPAEYALRYARRTEIRGREWVLAAHGPGPRLAGEAARKVLEGRKECVVLSTGFCGALQPELEVGAIVVAREVLGHKVYAALEPHSTRPDVRGAVRSMDKVAVTVEEKKNLAGDGACAVEMEAGAVAGEAERRAAPFYCVRVVSDTSREDLPLDFNTVRDSEGRFSTARIFWRATLHPGLLPGLVRLGRQSRLASEALGDYLADCEF